MRLPVAILLFVAVCLVVAPWRRSDPRHEFIFEQLRMLSEPEASVAESPAAAEELSGYRSAVGHHHSAGSADV